MTEPGQEYTRTIVVAEAGVNHNGRMGLAEALVDAAASVGADAVKFQTFTPETLVTRTSEKADYQKETTGAKETQYEMLAKLVLDDPAHRRLIARCRQRNIRFMSSPFSVEDVEYLHGLGLDLFKIPSGEITNLPYLRKIGALRKEIILSTGMAEMHEVEDAVGVLTAGGAHMEHLTLLHCTSAYPTPFEDVNLRAMKTLKEKFAIPVGLSDHTLGIEASVAAVALGAAVIEKHLTLDKTMEGPDHRASLDPAEFSDMVEAIRNVERALGDGVKRPRKSERDTRKAARKSIVARRPIHKGEVFTEENLTTRRPETGISPMQWDNVIGVVSQRDYRKDEPI